MSRKDTPKHVVRIPLNATPRDIQIVSEAMSIVGQLKNAALGEILQRVDAMRADPGWIAAREMPKGKHKRDPKTIARNKAYRALYKQYGLSSYHVVTVCHAHWKASGWMGDRLGGRIATGLASELWQNVREYLYGRAERPGFKPSAERDVVWNNDNSSGLLLRDGRVIWNVETARKCLSIPLNMASISQPRREWLAEALEEGRLRRVGIQRMEVRGKTMLFALICLEGAPYRSDAYLDSIPDTDDVVGLDLGPTWLAGVAEDDAFEFTIASQERIKADKKMRAKERRQKRAADRSRAAANPHARRKDGRSIKGVRQPQRSTRGKARQAKLADTKRKDTQTRERYRQEAVRDVMRVSPNVSMEDLRYRGWQRSLYGKRMMITAPGDFVARLMREAELLGGSVTLVNPWIARASQTCLCGVHTGRKDLNDRIHHCSVCGFTAPRDLVSASLVRELALADATVWDEGLAAARGFPEASGTQHRAMQLIASSRRTPSSSSTTAGTRGEKRSTDAKAQAFVLTAPLCANGKSDPEDKAHTIPCAPMRGSRSKIAAGASRKAADDVKTQQSSHRARRAPVSGSRSG